MKKAEVFPDETGIKGDSAEVMQAYYNGRLLQLQKELNQLTILEHPVQIQHICQRINKIKDNINKVKDKLYGPNNKKR